MCRICAPGQQRMKTRTALIIFVLVAIGVAVVFLRNKEPIIETISAERGTIVEEVSVTGRVKPLEKVELSFERAGRVARLPVSVSEQVTEGMLLVSLENSDEYAKRAETAAALATQKAALAELRAGSRVEEIAVAEAKLSAAEAAVLDSREGLLNDIRDAFTKSDDAVRNRVDQFISNPKGESPQLDFEVSNDAAIEFERILIESTLTDWSALLAGLSLESDLRVEASSADTRLAQVQLFLNLVAGAVNGLKINASLSQTTVDGWRSAVSTARTNVETARANLSAAKEALNANEATRTLRKNELLLTKAPATAEEIAVQEAKVREAEAGVARADASLAKTLLRAPFAGIVTALPVKTGEIVAANTIAVTLISENVFEIETFIPEADIAKVSLGDGALVTLDAYGDAVPLTARVMAIDPAETIIEGVSTYKTTLRFDETDRVEIKSGMTANVDIETNRKENVIVIPLKAVQYGAVGNEVEILSNGMLEITPVTTGIESAEGLVEIISGLSEGTAVVIYKEE